MEKQPPNYYGNNYSNQPYPNQNMGMNPNYNNPYVNNQMPDYPLPNAGNDNNSNDKAMAISETMVLFETCLAIAFGFLIVDVASRTIMRAMKREYHIGKHS